MHTPLTPPEPVTRTMSDGYVLRGRLWRSTNEARNRVILYLHGIQSHGGWFEWSASVLAKSGWAVLLPDRRGSGLNTAARGDTPSAARWLADLDELADWAQRELGVACPGTAARRSVDVGAPVAAVPGHGTQLRVIGVSWGGKLAVAWALTRPQRVQRLLLIAPGLFPAVDVGLGGRLRIGVSLLTHPTRGLPIPLDDPALFTNNPAGQAFIAADGLKLTHGTARFFYESARLDRQLVRATKGSLLADTTLILAGRERIVRNGPTLKWLTRLAARPPTVHTLTDAAHTLEFEADVEPFGRLIETWAGS